MFKIVTKRQPQPDLHNKDDNLTVNDDTITVPGKLLTTNADIMRGHGTYSEDGALHASVAGVTDQVNKLLLVKSVKPRYSGEIGDVVIGRIIEVQANRWLVDINSTQFSVLLLSNVNLPGGELRRKKFEDQLLMIEYMKVGDLVSAEVQRGYIQGYLGLHTRSMKYGKLGQGILIKVPCSLVKRRKAHFLNLSVGASVILAVKDATSEERESGGYILHTQSVGVEMRKVLARLANCVKALARNYIPLSDTTILSAYETSMGYEISDLIDPRIADQIAREVLTECATKDVDM
ncbi:Ribosomal RNA-processing protein 4 [Aphelenchoides bicaudatus]|nr:Ribosomal RNA-processing protein 4 [Aphelenchoides bicaudatus]